MYRDHCVFQPVLSQFVRPMVTYSPTLAGSTCIGKREGLGLRFEQHRWQHHIFERGRTQVGRRERREPGFDVPTVLGMRGANFGLEKGDSFFHHGGASLPMQHRQNNNVAGFDPVDHFIRESF